MSQKSNRLESNLDRLDKAFFYPLEKMRLKYEGLRGGKNNNVVVFDSEGVEEIVEEKKLTTFRNVDEAINAESAIGRTIFGPIPAGHRREFFKYKDNIWIWHESWTEEGKPKEITVRYEVRKDGVYKKIGNGKGYQKIKGDELENFRKALHAYLRVVKEKLY